MDHCDYRHHHHHHHLLGDFSGVEAPSRLPIHFRRMILPTPPPPTPLLRTPRNPHPVPSATRRFIILPQCSYQNVRNLQKQEPLYCIYILDSKIFNLSLHFVKRQTTIVVRSNNAGPRQSEANKCQNKKSNAKSVNQSIKHADARHKGNNYHGIYIIMHCIIISCKVFN